MSWTTAASDLRTMLSDNSKDKHCYRKKVLGNLDGVNTRFKTLEFRRLQNFKKDTPSTDPDATVPPLGVWKNGTLLTVADIADDYKDTGDFSLVTAPQNTDTLEASYFAQWFTDDEIIQFLRVACNWLALGDDYSNIEPGLRPAALKYGAAEAYQKLSSRWAQMLSEQYLMADAMEKGRFNPVDAWMRSSELARKEAYKTRDDFYGRSGQSNIPFAGSIQGRVSNPVPER